MDIKKPFGRALTDFESLTSGEQKLLDACAKGKAANLGSAVPESATDQDRVRAAFIRFLLLGGDEQAPVHERGVYLRGAFIEGMLDLSGCGIVTNVCLTHCRFANAFYASDARLAGLLNLQGSHLVNGLTADRVRCSAGVFLRKGFKATGVVRLLGAQIGGSLSCRGGQFEGGEGGALLVDGAEVNGKVLLDDGFRAIGAVRLLGAQIGGNLNCRGGHFQVKEDLALSIDGAVVKGDVLLGNGFKATGTIGLQDAQIGGVLDCSNGQIEPAKGAALSGDSMAVKGNILLSNGFKATGEVRLLGAQIGGTLNCSGGQFEVREGKALIFDRAEIKGSIFLRNGFKATGEVRLLGAQIGGSLNCKGGQFEVRKGHALCLESAVVRGTWFLHNIPQPVTVNAAHANVAVLADDLAAWARESVLNGLNYASFGGQAPTSGAERLEWLCRQSSKYLGDTDDGADFRPQPWRQLQRVLREMGHTEDAKQVGIALQDRLRAIGHMGHWPNDICDVPRCLKGMVTRSAHYIFGKLAGYGYRPVNLVSWMFSVWLVCGAAYWWLALPPQSAIAPSDPLVFQSQDYKKCQPNIEQHGVAKKLGNWYLCTDLPGEYSTFSPFAFSLDLLLPVVDLGQEKSWGAFIPTPKESPWEELFLHWHPGHIVRILTWLQTLFGWLCSLLLVAIVSGYSRRNEEPV